MAIKSQVEWTGEEVKGYVDMGGVIKSDVAVVAKEALVFMLVVVNDHWNIPVGYFLLNGLSGAEKANLINKCLNFLQESEITVSCLIFDGHMSNINMCTQLGLNFNNVENLKISFRHPVTSEDI